MQARVRMGIQFLFLCIPFVFRTGSPLSAGTSGAGAAIPPSPRSPDSSARLSPATLDSGPLREPSAGTYAAGAGELTTLAQAAVDKPPTRGRVAVRQYLFPPHDVHMTKRPQGDDSAPFRIPACCPILGHPHRFFPTIHALTPTFRGSFRFIRYILTGGTESPSVSSYGAADQNRPAGRFQVRLARGFHQGHMP